MFKKLFFFVLFISIAMLFTQCKSEKSKLVPRKTTVRGLVDTVGFAHLSWQMDSLMQRILRLQKKPLLKAIQQGEVTPQTQFKVAISPHDDYGYVGYLYPAVMEGIKAKTVIIFGVAHKARLLNLENQIIFDTYPAWHGPYGPIKVSNIREEIINQLPDKVYQINDSMQTIEHSVEALLPFLQYYRRDREFVSILVPYMSFERMRQIAQPLARAIAKVANRRHWQWGRDFALVISTDAVHYGDQDWGGKNFAFYGVDSAGYEKAVAHEMEIINNCLKGPLREEGIRKFTQYTVQVNDFKKYKWTWCGRYSVPMGLETAYYLSKELKQNLTGRLIGYANSIDHAPLPVKDLRMGFTAPANMHHWVGYVAMGWE